MKIEKFKEKIDPVFSPLQRAWSYLDTRETNKADSGLRENDAAFDINMAEEMFYHW